MVYSSNPQDLAEANNKFAFKLFQELQTTNDNNLFYSPFSISTALAMTYGGARGTTAIQMSKTMEFLVGDQFHSDYKNLLNSLSEVTKGGIILNIANSLWAQKDFKFLPSYFTLVKSNYNSEIKNVDFQNNLKRENSRKEINSWVEQKTNDKIKDILKQGDLNEDTKLVLVNAIYFYSDWAKPFKKAETEPRDFFLLGGSQIQVPLMFQKESFGYYEDSKIKALEIPYKDKKVSMLIFLPNTNNGITEFEKTFDSGYYQKIIASLHSNLVRLYLPKCQLTFKVNLKTTLSHMGMPMAFSAGADFSGMTGKKDLCISEIIHQAFINVDELGTEAAAATAVVMKGALATPPRPSKVFKADHPFIFCIKDNATGSILFMGKIMKPNASTP